MKTIARGVISTAFVVYSLSLLADVPQRTSNLNGWKGLKVVVDKSDGPKQYCRVVFPAGFGSINEDDYKDLLTIIRRERPTIYDHKCIGSLKSEALEHLVSLATRLQNQRAADSLLKPSASEDLKLDGALAEEFAIDQQRRVLLAYKKAGSLLRQYPGSEDSLVERLVYGLCNEWGYMEYKDMRENLAKGLRSNGLGNMAKKFESDCSVSIKNNPDIQRMLKGK
jgi:hypothetical protein